MDNGLSDRQPLYSLCSPLWFELPARDSPDFFRVLLKKGLIQLATKSVNEEILERLFFANRRQADAQAEVSRSSTGSDAARCAKEVMVFLLFD